MKKIIALLPVLSLLFMSCMTFSPDGREIGVHITVQTNRSERHVEPKRGAWLEILDKGGRFIKGELLAVEQDSLLIWELASGIDIFVDIHHIKTIKLTRKSRAYEGALIGGALGTLIGAATYQEPRSTGWGVIDFGPEFNAAAGGLMGMAAGGLIGAAAGADQTLQIEGKSDSEIRKMLEILNSHARFPSNQ